MDKKRFNMITNYIYLYHINTFVIVPVYPDNITDQSSVTFAQENPIARSAPIYSYSNSGPRSMTINLRLHRELMSQVNYGKSNAKLGVNDDYVDLMIRQLQAAALPRYSSAQKMVDPPMVAVRFGNEIFIKGIVSGSVSVAYETPILPNDKYAVATISFTVLETDPYDAETVMQCGSFRNISTTLERGTVTTGTKVKATTRTKALYKDAYANDFGISGNNTNIVKGF